MIVYLHLKVEVLTSAQVFFGGASGVAAQSGLKERVQDQKVQD